MSSHFTPPKTGLQLWRWVFFGFRGNLSRWRYIWGFLGLVAAWVLAYALILLTVLYSPLPELAFIFPVIVVWMMSALLIKRIRDLGLPAILCFIICIFGIWILALIAGLFIKGDSRE